jgi:type I restriction enzyme, S subunit
MLKQLREKYKLQKRGLMQKILTGAWRVKTEIINQYLET